MSTADPSGVAAAAVLGAIGGLHVAWAAGSSWPARDREALGAAVAGRGPDSFPPASASLAVAGLLFTAAGFVVVGFRPGAAAAGAVVGARGVVGLVRPDLLPAGRRPPFARLNRRYYSPLCIAIAAGIARSVTRRRAGT